VAYGEIPVSSIGSLSYAEDDSRHLLGVKATGPVALAASINSDMEVPMESSTFCCYVMECANEVCRINDFHVGVASH